MEKHLSKKVYFAIIVSALGYFVDVYDLFLFSVVRQASLRGIGVPEHEIFAVGIFLFNVQMGSMLVGGVLCGMWGDKGGRVSVLFGTILLYSLANIGNAFVTNVTGYALMRALAGLGLAGELGAGITLISELLGAKKSGYAATFISSLGMLGALVAVVVAKWFTWRVAYGIGGVLGLLLLLMRVSTLESPLFQLLKEQEGQKVSRGNFFHLFSSWARAQRYFKLIGVGLPIWCVTGVLVHFSPEIGRQLGMVELPVASKAIMCDCLGKTGGACISGLLSQWLKSRKRVMIGFLSLLCCAIGFYFVFGKTSVSVFYIGVIFLGFATGYGPLSMTMAAEQFGTNLRATVTTSVQNFVRGAVVPLTMLILALQAIPFLGLVRSVVLVLTGTILLAFAAALNLEETYGRELQFVE